MLKKIKTLAIEKDCTPSQLAIAWLLAQGEDIITILGTKPIKYREENIVCESVKLTANDLESIEAIMTASIVSGARYPRNVYECLEPVNDV